MPSIKVISDVLWTSALNLIVVLSAGNSIPWQPRRTCSHRSALEKIRLRAGGREDQFDREGGGFLSNALSSANKRCIDIVLDKTLPIKEPLSSCLVLNLCYLAHVLIWSCRSKKGVISGNLGENSLKPLHLLLLNYAHRQDARCSNYSLAANCSIREASKCIFAHPKVKLASLGPRSRVFPFGLILHLLR